MDAVPSNDRLGAAAIARYWREHGVGCTRQYADRCIKALGCPTDSLEAALAWRTARTGKKPTGRGEGGAGQRAALPMEVLGDSLDACLARARQTEVEQYRVWREAIAAKDPAAQERALKSHAAAQKNLIEIEEKIFAVKKERAEYVNLAEAQRRIDDRLTHLRAAMPAFPRMLALHFFPEAPAAAQAKIERMQAEHFASPLVKAERPLLAVAPPVLVPSAQSAA